MRRSLLMAALLCLAVPAAHAAPPAGNGKPDTPASSSSTISAPSASQLCRQQRRSLGMADFRALYALSGSPKDAMDTCLARQVQVASTAAKNAAKTCGAERDKDPAAFKTNYGTSGNGANAFGRCVSSLVSNKVEAQQAATLSAARACEAERDKDPLAFKTNHGKNGNGANAFGKCVSQLAKKKGSSS